MADVILYPNGLTVPDAKVTAATQGFLKIYPNVELNDPADPESGLKYTTKQWIEEKLRRLLVRDVRRGLSMIANEASQVSEDDGIATIG